MSTAVSRVTLHIDTARKCAVAPGGGQISVILRASDCQFGGSRELSDFCNRLLDDLRKRVDAGGWAATHRRLRSVLGGTGSPVDRIGPEGTWSIVRRLRDLVQQRSIGAYVRFVANRSVHLRRRSHQSSSHPPRTQRGRPSMELAPVTIQRNPVRLRRSEGMTLPSQPPRNHDREVHASVVTASRTSSCDLRESPRHPGRAPRAAFRISPDAPNLARSAESWQSGRRRSCRSAGTPRFLQAPPPT